MFKFYLKTSVCVFFQYILTITSFVVLLITELASLNHLPQTNVGVAYANFQPNCRETPCYQIKVIKIYPHNQEVFTQGLVVVQPNIYYESSGGYKHSSLRKVNLTTGKILRQYNLGDQYFAEGLTLYRNKLYLLTWNENKVFVYNKKFKLLSTLYNPTSGWGLTHDRRFLISSDGSANVYFRDPETFSEKKRIQVHDKRRIIFNINELEFVKGFIYANIFGLDYVAIIDPNDGLVTAWINMQSLREYMHVSSKRSVLNGIASMTSNSHLLVTGKNWPALFEIAILSNTSD